MIFWRIYPSITPINSSSFGVYSLVSFGCMCLMFYTRPNNNFGRPQGYRLLYLKSRDSPFLLALFPLLKLDPSIWYSNIPRWVFVLEQTAPHMHVANSMHRYLACFISVNIHFISFRSIPLKCPDVRALVLDQITISTVWALFSFKLVIINMF